MKRDNVFPREKDFTDARAIWEKTGSPRLFFCNGHWKQFHELNAKNVKAISVIIYFPDGGRDYVNSYMRGVIARDVAEKLAVDQTA